MSKIALLVMSVLGIMPIFRLVILPTKFSSSYSALIVETTPNKAGFALRLVEIPSMYSFALFIEYTCHVDVAELALN
jgi:hypothetical protein